jgi:hypothetical protein
MLTIVSPNIDRGLLTLPELRSAAGVTDEARDAELEALGGYISALITNACAVTRSGAIPPTLRLESVIETFNDHPDWYHRAAWPHARAVDSLRPSRLPIVSIEQIVEGAVTLDPSEYEIDGARIFRLTGGRRSHWRHERTTVTYTAGWADVPLDLKYAAIKFVQVALVQGGRDPLLKRKVTVGVSEYEWWVDPTKDSIVPPEVMDILLRGAYVNRWGWMR